LIDNGVSYLIRNALINGFRLHVVANLSNIHVFRTLIYIGLRLDSAKDM